MHPAALVAQFDQEIAAHLDGLDALMDAVGDAAWAQWMSYLFGVMWEKRQIVPPPLWISMDVAFMELGMAIWHRNRAEKEAKVG